MDNKKRDLLLKKMTRKIVDIIITSTDELYLENEIYDDFVFSLYASIYITLLKNAHNMLLSKGCTIQLANAYVGASLSCLLSNIPIHFPHTEISKNDLH